MQQKTSPQHPPPREAKRGRGRPRLPDALTPAQRAKRYRDKKRARQAAEAAERRETAVPGHDGLMAENARLHRALELARIRISDLTGALEFFVLARARNRKITADQLKGLHTLLAQDSPLADDLPNYKKRR